MKTAGRIFITGAMVVTLAYFGWKWWQSFSISDKFKVSMSGKSFKIFGLYRGHFDIALNVTQTFPFDITSTGYNLRVSLNGNDISTLQSSIGQVLKTNTPSVILLSGDFDPTKAVKAVNLQTIMNIFKAPEQNIIRVYGTINIKAQGVSINNIPIDQVMTLKDFLPS